MPIVLLDYGAAWLPSHIATKLHCYQAIWLLGCNTLPQVAGYLSISSLRPTARESSIASSMAELARSQIWSSDSEIDCDVLFQYCDLREIFEPLGYINAALQYDAVPYRKWSSPLDLKEIGMDDLSLHEKCALQLGWELAGKDDSRDRADMSVEELIDFGETEAEERELEVWLHGYMDPYEGEIDTAKYSMAEIVSKLFSN